MRQGCTQSCVCQQDGTIGCTVTSCQAGATCVSSNAFSNVFFECQCPAGMTGDGLTCSGESIRDISYITLMVCLR